MKDKKTILLLLIGILTFIFSILIDNQVNLMFQDIHITFVDFIFSIVTNFGVVLVVMLIVPSFMLYAKNRKSVNLLFLTFFVSAILSILIKFIVLRQRPIDAFAFPFTALVSYSFPSMHALVVFSLLPLLNEYLPKQRYFWTGFAFAVAFTRLYFRFHFLSDIVFGALIGYFIGVLQLHLHEKGKIWKKAD